ncbi:hypothetical protein MERGE_000160 [Pneumocystis wakefieldiae]|uniref:Peptidase M20 dimerisation domain-containing protein n=1 Tax=Pneumocystis wakefieldiae TaxID=38082 RepID=A0A899FPK4_9ASCO|nr:hypothetical protein MERGE_000160 [Pneumocystis wakefieldiae]
MTCLDKFFETVDALEQHFIDRLSDLVSVPSVSCTASNRQDVFKVADLIYQMMISLGIDAEKRCPGTQVIDGQEIDLPPVLLGKYGCGSGKKTVLLYGNPASLSDGWRTDPWKLEYNEETDCMYGRGVTDDKGMEETGSLGLYEIIQEEADKYFADVDCICISDNYWLGTEKPCLSYGLRGIQPFTITVSGPPADLHSGIYGGITYEPMTDLIYLLSSLVKPNGAILVPGIMDKVDPLTSEEKALYEGISICIEDIERSLGSKTLVYDNIRCTLMHRWRYPSLSIHGIEGAYSSPGIKTVIPAKVSGKVSIRLVPNMDCNEVSTLVKKHLESVFATLGSKNVLTIQSDHGAKAWLSSVKHWNYQAATEAVKKVFGVTPDFTREGGSIPVVLTMESCLNKNVLLLPMGRGDDGPHSINEKLDRSNYIQGIKLFGAYLSELAVV